MLPNTEPVIDDIAGLEFVARRAREVGLVKIYRLWRRDRGLAGKELAEMGLLAEAGAVGFTDGTGAIADALMMRRALSYAATFDKMIVQHPEEPTLPPAADERGRDFDPAGPLRHSAARRDHHAGARPAAGRADRRALSRRACLDGGGSS
jgi:dihydroorotase-like cyclic amidohydrolase